MNTKEIIYHIAEALTLIGGLAVILILWCLLSA